MTAETNKLVILNPPDTTKIKPSTNEFIWETVIDTEVSHSSIWSDTTNKSNNLLGGYISTRATSTGNMKRLASPRLISWFPPGLGTMKNVNENQKSVWRSTSRRKASICLPWKPLLLAHAVLGPSLTLTDASGIFWATCCPNQKS